MFNYSRGSIAKFEDEFKSRVEKFLHDIDKNYNLYVFI